MASFCIRVDAVNEDVYELVAEPIPEPQAGEPQAEAAVDPDPEDLVNPADLQGKPRSMTVAVPPKLIRLKCANHH